MIDYIKACPNSSKSYSHVVLLKTENCQTFLKCSEPSCYHFQQWYTRPEWEFLNRIPLVEKLPTPETAPPCVFCDIRGMEKRVHVSAGAGGSARLSCIHKDCTEYMKSFTVKDWEARSLLKKRILANVDKLIRETLAELLKIPQ